MEISTDWSDCYFGYIILKVYSAECTNVSIPLDYILSCWPLNHTHQPVREGTPKHVYLRDHLQILLRSIYYNHAGGHLHCLTICTHIICHDFGFLSGSTPQCQIAKHPLLILCCIESHFWCTPLYSTFYKSVQTSLQSWTHRLTSIPVFQVHRKSRWPLHPLQCNKTQH